MKYSATVASLVLPSLVFSAALERRISKCTDVKFTVSASAVNRVAENPPKDFSNPEEVIKFLTQPVVDQPVSGTQTLYGQYCAPVEKIVGASKTLQLLVHGNSYDHKYFNGFEESPQNPTTNYVRYANSKGYATLAIDRLGSGNSDHPDPINLVQAPYQAELLHSLIVQLRSGKARMGTAAAPTKIAWVGHSYGSIIGTQLSLKHPSDIDAFIHTGLAVPGPEDNALPGELADAYVQASEYDPIAFPPGPYSPGYLVTASSQGREETFYSAPADYDAALYALDFKTKGILTLGEALTQNLYVSTTYSNPVFAITGQQDAVFCGMGSRVIGTPDCGEGETSKIAALKTYYPAVPEGKFEYYAQPKAGHCHHQHYTAVEGYEKVIDFLRRNGL